MRIEQLLYGYDDGHGLLAGSIVMASAKDSARLSTLSDWSGYRMPEGNDSTYITAFSLINSPYYAVAKSWYAQEMERPGCVWTHIFLINLDTIDALFDFRSLFDMFKRPIKGEYQQYKKSIEVVGTENMKYTSEVIFADFASVLFLYSTLLRADSPFGLKVEKDSITNQLFTLSLMQYIPVRVLKKISFSTGGNGYRRLDQDNLLTMQFVQQGNAVSLLSPPWQEQIKKENFNEGLHFLVNACINNNIEIAKMMRIFAKDIEDNLQKISAFGVLMKRLHEGIQGKQLTNSYTEIITILTKAFPTSNEGEMLKYNFLGKKIVSLYCSEGEFLYEICTLENITVFKEEAYEFNQRLGQLIVDQRAEYIGLLIRLANSDYVNINGKHVMRSAFQKLKEEEIAELSDKHWHTFTTLVMLNPDYLMLGNWLSFPYSKFKDMLSCFILSNHDAFTNWNQLLQRILSEGENLPQKFCHELLANTNNANFTVLDYINNPKAKSVDHKIVHEVCRNERVLLEWCNGQSFFSQAIESLVIKYINPTSIIVKEYGSKMWLSFASSDDNRKSIEYYLLLFQLSFLWKNADSIELLKHSFYHIHEALKYSSEKVWEVVCIHSAELPFWQEWDKCKKIRKGLVSYLKKSGYERKVLQHITPDINLNNQMLDLWYKV